MTKVHQGGAQDGRIPNDWEQEMFIFKNSLP